MPATAVDPQNPRGWYLDGVGYFLVPGAVFRFRLLALRSLTRPQLIERLKADGWGAPVLWPVDFPPSNWPADQRADEAGPFTQTLLGEATWRGNGTPDSKFYARPLDDAYDFKAAWLTKEPPKVVTPEQQDRAIKIGQLAAVFVDPKSTVAQREAAKKAANEIVASAPDQAEKDRLSLVILKAIKEGVPPLSTGIPSGEPPDIEAQKRIASVKALAGIIGAFDSTPQQRKDALAAAKAIVLTGATQAERDELSAIVLAAVQQAAKPGPDGYNQLTIEAAARLERERALAAIKAREEEEKKKAGGSSLFVVAGLGLVALVGGVFLLGRK